MLYQFEGQEFSGKSARSDLIDYIYNQIVNDMIFTLSDFWKFWYYLFFGRLKKNISSDEIPLFFFGIKKDNNAIEINTITEIAGKVAEMIKSDYPDLCVDMFAQKESDFMPIWEDSGKCNFEKSACDLSEFEFGYGPNLPSTIEETIINIELADLLTDSLIEALTLKTFHDLRYYIFRNFFDSGENIMGDDPRMIIVNSFYSLHDNNFQSKLEIQARKWLDEKSVEDIDEQLERFKYAVLYSLGKTDAEKSDSANTAFALFVKNRALIKIGETFVFPAIKVTP